MRFIVLFCLYAYALIRLYGFACVQGNLIGTVNVKRLRIAITHEACYVPTYLLFLHQQTINE